MAPIQNTRTRFFVLYFIFLIQWNSFWKLLSDIFAPAYNTRKLKCHIYKPWKADGIVFFPAPYPKFRNPIFITQYRDSEAWESYHVFPSSIPCILSTYRVSQNIARTYTTAVTKIALPSHQCIFVQKLKRTFQLPTNIFSVESPDAGLM